MNLSNIVPPLPDPIPTSQDTPDVQDAQLALIRRSVRCGCWLINYTPSGQPLVSYDGTMRVECHRQGRTASGDLYQRRLILIPQPGLPPRPPVPVLGPAPLPSAGIPILPRNQYRYYLRITKILETFTFGTSFTLEFEMYRFTAPNAWANEGKFTAKMSWATAPAGFPSSADFLTGSVKNASGVAVGKLTMGWVSEFLRKATIEIDRVAVSEAPLNNGDGVDWRNVYKQVGWDVTVVQSNADVAEPSGESWSDAEMHAAMLARRDASNLDAEWRYHILAVRKLDSTPRGIMYDAFATDSNNVPREGIGISSHWIIPNTAEWGLVKGLRVGTASKPFFRTAVHEIGHAMGLFHNTVDNGFMNTTDVIAASGTPANPFPNTIKWSFASDDQNRLRHYPDPFVRPGGVAFGGASTTTPPITPADLRIDADGLELRVTPLLAAVPLGAPVRVNLELVNRGASPQYAPESLSMKKGAVSGLVTDPSGTARSFSPLLRCVEEDAGAVLEPGASLRDSATLLRGGQGALFPSPGVHRITVEVRWDAGGVECVATGEASIVITPAVDAAHAEAALKVLSTPDTVLTLAIGGDHLADGIDAIQAALNNATLAPHFAFIEAKRLAERFGKRKPNLKAAADLIDDNCVMSQAEVKKAAKLVGLEKADAAARASIGKTLKKRVKKLDVSDEIKGLVESL
jgi:hypothetical protein